LFYSSSGNNGCCYRLGICTFRKASGRRRRFVRNQAGGDRSDSAGALGIGTNSGKNEIPSNLGNAFYRARFFEPASSSLAFVRRRGSLRGESDESSEIGIGSLAGTATAFSLVSLFLVFLKIGTIVFGSGYVLLAYLRADLVVNRGWLTDAQLVDAVAVGQVTPGPVFTTATFIGFILGGIRGAAISTVGIFLPAFLLVAVSGPLVPRIRKSKAAGAFLDGVNVASLALMAAVSWQLGRASVVDVVTVVLAFASLIALLRFRVNSAWLVMAGAIVGLIANTFYVPR
jgi:chromate transport protein ChrA